MRRPQGRVRRCPSCGELKIYDEDAKGGEFYDRKHVWIEGRELVDSNGKTREYVRRIPSGYCRSCSNQKRNESRRRKKARDIVARAANPQETTDLRGTCDTCGREGVIGYARSPRPMWLCWACRTLLGDGLDRKRLLDVLHLLVDHNRRPLRTRKAERWDRGAVERWTEPVHTWSAISDHQICKEMEERARTLVVVMVSKRKPTLA